MTVPTLETLSRPVEAASTMTRRWPWIVVALVYCVVIPSPSSGATSGNEWRGLSDFNRALYVAGVLDGWQAVRVTLPPGAERYQFDQFQTALVCGGQRYDHRANKRYRGEVHERPSGRMAPRDAISDCEGNE